jgi:hypothetical protein
VGLQNQATVIEVGIAADDEAHSIKFPLLLAAVCSPSMT